MPVRQLDGWFFSEALGGYQCCVALLSLEPTQSQAGSAHDWIIIDEQIDGMACSTLEALVLILPVPEDRLEQLVAATEGGGAWRDDLSWHNTPMRDAQDPTVAAYLEAIGALGLAWTPPPGDARDAPLGIRLAQGAYPMDPTDANLRSLGLSETVAALLGRAPDPKLHSIVLLAPGDD